MRAASLFLLLTLAACAGGPDGEQEWLCRRIAPALFDGEKKLTVLSSTAGRSRDVFVRLSVEASPGTHVVYCRFAGSGFSPRKRELVAVSVDGQAMSEAGVHFLREGWLQAQESITAAPPRARPEGEATLGAGTAYALQQALSALPKTGIIVLLCAAYALLYGLTGRINLAFGGFVALGGMAMTIGAAAMDIAGAPGILAPLAFGLACAVTLSALHGLVTAGLLFVPLAARPGQHILIASVGLMIALEEFLRLAQGAGTRWLAPVLNLPVTVARAPTYDVTVTPVALATAGTAAVAAIALLVYLGKSGFGRRWRAVADDPDAAILFGVAPGATIAASFALAATLAGLAGALVTVHYGGMGFAGGTTLGLTALVAAVLGGIGSVGGAMLGGLLIGALEAAWSAALPIEHRDAAVFLLLAVLLALKPDGLLAGRQPGPMRV